MRRESHFLSPALSHVVKCTVTCSGCSRPLCAAHVGLLSLLTLFLAVALPPSSWPCSMLLLSTLEPGPGPQGLFPLVAFQEHWYSRWSETWRSSWRLRRRSLLEGSACSRHPSPGHRGLPRQEGSLRWGVGRGPSLRASSEFQGPGVGPAEGSSECRPWP